MTTFEHEPTSSALSRGDVAAEFGLDDADPLRLWLDHRDDQLLEHNLDVARAHFDLADLPREIEGLLESLGLA